MVGDVTVAAPQASSEGYIRELRRGLRQVLGVLEDLIAKIEKIEKRLKELENAGTGRTSGPLPPGAARVASNLEITPCANGSGAFEVSIDGGESFSLGPRLAGVLRFIASGDKERGGARSPGRLAFEGADQRFAGQTLPQAFPRCLRKRHGQSSAQDAAKERL